SLREPVVIIGRRLVHAQERRDIEAVRAERRDCLTYIGAVGPDLVDPAAGGVGGKRSDIDQHARKLTGIGTLCNSLAQLGADDPLVAEPESDFRRWQPG